MEQYNDINNDFTPYITEFYCIFDIDIANTFIYYTTKLYDIYL